MDKAVIGMMGMGVMGGSLALNMDSKGFPVIGFDAVPGKVEEFLAEKGEGTNIRGARSMEEFIEGLERPRRVMLMVPAGKAVDLAIGALLPMLEPGDIIIDGGNSFYQDTNRRLEELQSRRVMFVGMGVSGGEEGALKGPSLMPGGSEEAWPHIKDIFQSIAARADDGMPCCEWIGPDGAGHFVKMVHNGIEYGDMQLIAETYSLLKDALGLNYEEMSAAFSRWNTGDLNSYLIEITADILSRVDPETDEPMPEIIDDVAQQKGTGSWAGETALQMGVPTPTLTEAVFARSMSALKNERLELAKLYTGPDRHFSGDKNRFEDAIHKTLYASKICCYAQGFALMREASRELKYNLKLGELASIWRAGCIIRARFLDRIKEAYDADPDLPNLLMAPYFRAAIQDVEDDWREMVCGAMGHGVPVPAFSSALAYFDSYRSARLPANLIQAQRDYFGAHTYVRIDRPGAVHTEWVKAFP